MKKIDNFKAYFSSVLEEKLKLNKEQINKYLVLKQKQESFDNKKFIGCMIGLGEMGGAALIGIIDNGNNPDLAIWTIILGGIGVLTAKISATKKNPFYFKEYREIDRLYSYEKSQYKKKK